MHEAIEVILWIAVGINLAAISVRVFDYFAHKKRMTWAREVIKADIPGTYINGPMKITIKHHDNEE